MNYKSSYGTTRKVAKWVSLSGWISVAGGILVVLISVLGAAFADQGFGLLAVLPALGVVVAGIFMVMNGQLTRASVDTADNTGESLEILREIIRQKHLQ